MKLNDFLWIALLFTLASRETKAIQPPFENDDYEFDFTPEASRDIRHFNSIERQKKFLFPNLHSHDEQLKDKTTTEYVTDTSISEEHTENEVTPTEMSEEQITTTPQAAASPQQTKQNPSNKQEQEAKTKELRNLIQHLYIAQARVQLEAAEIKKAQIIANSAQKALEEAANHVRSITAGLQSAQQAVAAAAISAQTAQLQLAAHDQLLFAARQDVDALSSQMVGLQAAEGISQPKIMVDLSGLLEKLKQPLPDSKKPTPVPTIIQRPDQPKFNNYRYQRRQQRSSGLGKRLS